MKHMASPEITDAEAEAFFKDLRNFAGAQKCEREGHDFAPAWLHDERLLRCYNCGDYKRIPKAPRDELTDPLSYPAAYPFLKKSKPYKFDWPAY